MSYDKTPRAKMRGVIKDAMAGPSFSFAAFGQMTSHQEEEATKSVRLWLDTWIVPQLQEIERKVFRPTRTELLRFDKHLEPDEKTWVAERTEKHGRKRRYPEARLKALEDLYNLKRHGKKESSGDTH